MFVVVALSTRIGHFLMACVRLILGAPSSGKKKPSDRALLSTYCRRFSSESGAHIARASC